MFCYLRISKQGVLSAFFKKNNVFSKKVAKIFGEGENMLYLCTRKQGNNEVNASNLRAK